MVFSVTASLIAVVAVSMVNDHRQWCYGRLLLRLENNSVFYVGK